MPANQLMNGRSSPCADLVALAERELAAFVGAVTELFGPEQARLAAEHWLDELISLPDLPGSSSGDWRAITLRAANTLAMVSSS